MGFPYLLDVNFHFCCSLIVSCFLDSLPLLMHFWRINDGDFCFILFTCCSLLWPVDVYLLSVCVEDVLFDHSWMVLLLSFSLLFCLCFLMSHLTMRCLLALSLFREMFSMWLYQKDIYKSGQSSKLATRTHTKHITSGPAISKHLINNWHINLS